MRLIWYKEKKNSHALNVGKIKHTLKFREKGNIDVKFNLKQQREKYRRITLGIKEMNIPRYICANLRLNLE